RHGRNDDEQNKQNHGCKRDVLKKGIHLLFLPFPYVFRIVQTSKIVYPKTLLISYGVMHTHKNLKGVFYQWSLICLTRTPPFAITRMSRSAGKRWSVSSAPDSMRRAHTLSR